jgi:hypothetical protein
MPTKVSTRRYGRRSAHTCAAEPVDAAVSRQTRRSAIGPHFCGPVCFHAWHQQCRHALAVELTAVTGSPNADVPLEIAGALARAEPAVAAAVLGWLTCSGGPQLITQLGLCEFLWYQLPVTGQDPAPVAVALGAVLDAYGLSRYARLCRSAATAKILHIYAECGAEAGRHAFAQALRRSGIVPPDVPELIWATAMGVAEVEAYEATAAMLELAVASGELRPGAAGWRARQAALTREYLRADLGGTTLLDRVRAERMTTWARSYAPTRRKLAAAVAKRFCEPLAVPAEALEHLAPLRWLLEQADHGRGLPLTDNHDLAAPVVAAAQESFGRDVVEPLRSLVEILHRMRALRRVGRRLVLTRTGRRLPTNPAQLWHAAMDALVGPDDSVNAAAAEATLLLLVDGHQAGREELARRVCDLLASEGWCDPATGAAPEPAAVRGWQVKMWRRLYALGLLADDRWLRPVRLTTLGQSGALAGLRSRALRPRRTIAFG